MSALNIPTTATADEAEAALRSWLHSLAPLAPDTAALIDTFAMVLLENGDNQKAQTQIERALKLEPNNPGMRFHAAQIRLALDDTDGAVLILKSLLGGKGDFAEKAEAEALLASLKKD